LCNHIHTGAFSGSRGKNYAAPAPAILHAEFFKIEKVETKPVVFFSFLQFYNWKPDLRAYGKNVPIYTFYAPKKGVADGIAKIMVSGKKRTNLDQKLKKIILKRKQNLKQMCCNRVKNVQL
jgi:hypothetical protein